MYPVSRDIPGYRIFRIPIPTGKEITVQIYLPPDAARTYVGTIFNERMADGNIVKRAQMPFAPNTGYASAVGSDTWHSVDPPGPEVTNTRQHPAHLIRRLGSAANGAEPRQAGWQLPAQRVALRAAASAGAGQAEGLQKPVG